jgi:exodeoxyribonuclease V gamma subunit
MREIEVLHDNLLDMLQQDPTLEPRDILVMTPDIESCSAYVEAVFGSTEDPSRKIPYSISDRTYRSEGRLTAPLLAILDLPGKRFSAPAVMDILFADAVAARFGLSDEDVGQAGKWLEDTMIRWGMNEQDRVKSGVPPFRENSWSAGLERLLLGYAMPDEGELLFAGILPYDQMEGSQAPLLGRFITFLKSLHNVISILERPCTLTHWKGRLQRIFDDFFMIADEDAKEAADISSLLESIGLMQLKSGFDRDLGLDVIRTLLAADLEKEGRGLGFMSGGVTFCSMLPMRSIPFRVIALVGMNDGAFPRRSSKPGFDLISRFPRRGDRSLRHEDRYLFLEALLSARDHLYISYTGQSMADNSPLPPSVLVSELQDYLALRYDSGDKTFLGSLITVHRLQPFIQAYFDGTSGLFSYSSENYRAACVKLGSRNENHLFFPHDLPEPPESMREVTLQDLLHFYANPAAFLLRTRLGINLDHPAEPLKEREPFELNGLDA